MVGLSGDMWYNIDSIMKTKKRQPMIHNTDVKKMEE